MAHSSLEQELMASVQKLSERDLNTLTDEVLFDIVLVSEIDKTTSHLGDKALEILKRRNDELQQQVLELALGKAFQNDIAGD